MGHLFAYTVAYDLVAESEDEKSEVSSVVDDIVGKHGVGGASQLVCVFPSNMNE